MPRSNTKGSRQARIALETLESRELLNGQTNITHGYQPFSNDLPSWVKRDGCRHSEARRTDHRDLSD